ncbi:hypothetical protein PM10SUCC1_04880 [Propionigenium maris DSM 9537]|uniref:Uncharacterized protein n=1 Tax=Propionigenium maris DSM 9537 TaxID=1123000 RepID=A0A9W6GIV3_9FUSO|nr:MarR family winged helix-turn-helix transcriptional regulator [Propionigenium maris]GLI54973.1 hypothetical protein PM10SUCC1_04880 [Propionigenium maris DSM 9537]
MDHYLHFNKMLEAFRVLCNACNLGVTYVEVLILIAIKGNSLNKKEVAEILLKDKSYMSKKIDSLYKRKYIVKDYSTLSYDLSEKGKKVLIEIEEVKNDIIRERSVDSMFEKEVVELLTPLEKF